MRIHGALRLAAATVFALALAAAPAIARQSSDDQRVRPESKATRDPVVRSPAAERSPTINRPPTQPATQPTIRRDFPRNDPADRLRQPNRDARIEREMIRNRERFPERQEIRLDAPTSSTRGRQGGSVSAGSLTEAVMAADDGAVVLRLDGYSPAERARILLELQDLLTRQQLEANKETTTRDEETEIAKPSDGPESPHVPNRERGRLVPPPDDPGDDGDDGATTPPITSGGNSVVWGWGMWGWWYRSRWSRFCASEARWYDLSPADRWELSRAFFGSWSPLWGFGFGPSWLYADEIGCPDREMLGYQMTWDEYVRRFEAKKKDSRDEAVSCARVTVHRFDGAAASFQVEMPALGAETLNELQEAISKRLYEGEAVELAVVLRPGDVEKFSVDACQAGN